MCALRVDCRYLCTGEPVKMEILRCMHGHRLCSWDCLYFYEQVPGSGNWHLIVKPEMMEILLRNAALILVASSKKSKWALHAILCPMCQGKVGMESPVGPSEEPLLCFDYKRVKLQDNRPPSKWTSVRSYFPNIRTWTGNLIICNPSFDEKPLVVPKPADFKKVEVSTLTRTIPRDYQIELFVRAALENSLIFLPTGTGKTLLAVMVVKFLRQLNEGKVGIFLAHRVPLVHQQARYLQEEGNLRVQVITGENSQLITDSANVNKICSEYEVLALTAQVFLNLLLKGFAVGRCSCIVFDEAHHAVGGHSYAKILQNMSLCAFESRPRILGLTASPAGEATYGATNLKVEELCHIYCSARVLMPVLYEADLHTTLSEAETKYAYVYCTSAEIQLQHDLWEYFYFQWDKLQARISEGTRAESNCPKDIRTFLWKKPQNTWTSICRRILQGLSSSSCSEQERCVLRGLMEKMFEILLLIDESKVHGVFPVRKQLREKGWCKEVGDGTLLEKLLTLNISDESSGTASSRVEALLKEIRSAIVDNPSSRILVFVQTRYTARALEYVLERIPDIEKLRPSRLVGHSGFDGMTWEEEQKPMLQRFRSGIVQLLIATSVLEEGIDVPSCNLVIRFDGMGSLTGTVQSRGRARLKSSKFIILLTEEERNRAHKVRCIEADMREVLRRKSSLPSTSATDIVNYLIYQKKSAPSSSSIENRAGEGSEDAEGQLSEQSFVVKLKFHTEWLTERILTDALRTYVNVLKCDMRCSLLYLGSFPGQDAVSTYRSICMIAIPQLIQQSAGEHVHLWFQRCSTEISNPVDDGDVVGSKKLELLGVFAGMFKDPNTFLQVYSPELGGDHHLQANTSESPSICWNSQEEFFSVHIPKEAISLEITTAAIDGWVLLHHDAQYTTHRLYIPLRQAPQVYSASANSPNQRLAADVDNDNSPKASFLNVMRDCLVFELLIAPRGKQEERFFDELVACLESHGVLICDTTVEDIFKLENSNSLEDGDDESFQFEEEVQPTETHSAVDDIPTVTIGQELVNGVIRRDHLTPVLQVRHSTQFCTSFLLECIFSQYACKFPRILVPEKFYEILHRHEQDVQERILQAMMGSVTWFCDPLVLLQQAVQKISPSPSPTHLLPTNYVPVRQATVTPSRVIFYEPLMIKSSRLLRHFDPENFLKVSFRDENMRFIPGNESKLMRRVHGTLRQGLRVAGRLFMFLGCSSSMLRAHTCWMTCLNPSEVRSWLGDFHEIRCVGKYMARVGLGMAASDETIRLEDRVVDDPIADVMRNNFCFSDGVGKISSGSLKEIFKYLHPMGNQWLDSVTAIQIRVAGYKGVVALDPTLPSDETQCLLRRSMRKFSSSHRRLEVINMATSRPVHLNRQAIILLSCLGVQDSTFERLQEEQLHELLKIFAEDQSEKTIARSCQALKLQSALHAGIHIPTEPFLQHILSAIYFQKVQRHVTKTHIFVPEGRLLMGVLDETNSLNYGEIFVQISDKSTDWKPHIISGRCVTYKNPCFHPGDVRVLWGRDVEGLRHLVNCVVFPTKGPRPHTDEMSGSDLDGDVFTVIWMPGLIPTNTFEPMSYDPGPLLEIPEVRDGDMFDFFVKTVESAELGLIANAHLALADSKPLGAMDQDCLELAELHARAVDFPKTGQQVCVRKGLIPSNYPDFMEKHTRPSYPSPKILGRLYRRARCLFGDDLKRHVNVCLKPDSSLVFEGYADCGDESVETYKQYCTLLRGLMQCYGVKQEAEIVTGSIVSMHDHLTSEIFQWTEVVKQQFQELVRTFRERFFASVSSPEQRSNPEQRYKLASAWYMAAYTDDYEETRCLSFPWVVSDVLAEIKHNKLGQGSVLLRDGAKPGQSLEESVYHSMRADFIEQHPTKFASLLERQDLLEKVDNCVKAFSRNASVKMFGSSSTYLFEPSVSDVDLCVKIENLPGYRESSVRRSSRSQIELLDEILPRLQQDFPGTSAIKDARVPILKNDSGSLAFDLTADDAGFRKSEMVLKFISRYPTLLLSLTAVVKWARNVGLIASQSRGQFTAFSISWLLIQFCLEQGYVQSLHSIKEQINTGSSSSSLPSSLVSIIEEILDPVPDSQKRFSRGDFPSEILLHFFRHYADLGVNSLAGATEEFPFRIPDPLRESTYSLVQLDSSSYMLFRNRCLQAWHAVTRTRNVKSLYVLGERHVCMRLSRFQSSLIRGEEELYANRLSILTCGKARVRISCHGKRSDNVYQSRHRILHVDIQGDPIAVHIVEKELQLLNSGHCWIPAARQTFYVKGATFLLFEGSLSDQDSVGFVTYSGQCHLKHVNCRQHVPALVARVGGLTWMNHALNKLRASMWRQRQYLLNSDANSASPVHALIRFGTLYVTNVPFDLGEQKSIRSLSIAELEEYIVRGRKQMPPENISQHTTSEPVAGRSVSAAARDHVESDYSDDIDHTSTRLGDNRRRRKKFKQQQLGASQSLFPHVHDSLEQVLKIVRSDEFIREHDGDSGEYFVTLLTPKEWRVRLNPKLEFLSLTRRPIRWLCGSLLFENEDSKPQLATYSQQQKQRPNCVRFHVRNNCQFVDGGELLEKVKRNAVLEFTKDHGQVIRVGAAFRGKVSFVRWVKKERWLSKRSGVSANIMNVTEWEGWNKDPNTFKSHKSRQEVEVHMLDTDAHFRGSDGDFERFIGRFWHSAMRFKEAIF